jgi:hypothetical protein
MVSDVVYLPVEKRKSGTASRYSGDETMKLAISFASLYFSRRTPLSSEMTVP